MSPAERWLRADAKRIREEWYLTTGKPFVRSLLYQAQEGLCLCCGARMTIQRGRNQIPTDATLEHVRPTGLGGLDVPGNIALTRFSCNNAKASRWPTEAELAALEALNAKLGWPTVATWDDWRGGPCETPHAPRLCTTDDAES